MISRFRRSSSRPIGPLIALVVGIVGVVLTALGVLLPVFGPICSAEGATGTVLVVPVGRVVVALLVTFGLAVGLLVAAGRSQRTALAWVLAVVAVVVVAFGSVYPLIAVASSAVGQARDLVPWIRDLITRVAG